jgi:hypothetical protein
MYMFFFSRKTHEPDNIKGHEIVCVTIVLRMIKINTVWHNGNPSLL